MTDKLLRSKRRKKILFSCLATSLILHIFLLGIIYKTPMVFTSSFPISFARTSSSLVHDEDAEPLEKSKILEEVFNQMSVASLQRRPLIDAEPLDFHPPLRPYVEEISTLATSVFLTPLESIREPPPVSLTPPSLKEEHTSLLETDFLLPIFFSKAASIDPSSFQIAAPTKQPFANDTSPQSAVAATEQEFPRVNPQGAESSAIQTMERDASASLSTPLPAKDFTSKQQLLVPFKVLSQPADLPSSSSSAVNQRKLPQITSYELPESQPSIDWGEHFDVDLQIANDPSGKGYLFSLALQPRSDLRAHQLKQNFTFLIDRSNSIEKTRYETFKKATLRALSSLKEGDAFNIIFFDRKIYRLNETPLPFSKATLSLAREFLNSKPHSTLFTATEIYLMLEKIIDKPLNEEEVHTVFLLSDGNTLLNLRKQKRALLRLTEENDGKLSLYTVAAGSDNNITLLDLLSSSNRGRLIYSRTHAALPRKLTKALIGMREPLVKEITLSALSSASDVSVELFPPSYRTPTLYGKEPYLIFGKIDKLSDFTLFLDGRNRDQWISIQKNISFAGAKKRTALLDKKWALQEIKGYYESFLKEGKPDMLKKANQALKPYGGPIAFE
jgi:hypothetical protein